MPKVLELLIPIKGADSVLNPLHFAMSEGVRYELSVELRDEGIIVRATPIQEQPAKPVKTITHATSKY